VKVKIIAEGGAMQPGPAVAQQLGPMGINLGQVINDVNEATNGFKGMKVPVELDVDPKTKQYTISVSSPPVAELIKKELKIEKGSGEAGEFKSGNIAIEQIISIAKTKLSDLLAKDLKAAVKMVVGTCVSLGVLVESKDAKETMQDITKGVYDKEIQAEKTELSPDKKKKLDAHFKKVELAQAKKLKEREEAEAAEEAAKAAKAAAPAEGEEGAAPAEGAEGETPVEGEEGAAPAEGAEPAAEEKKE